MSFLDNKNLKKEIMESKANRRHTIGYKGILKEISNDNTGNNSDAKAKIKRRVSFAPEVTLHKINIVSHSVKSDDECSSAVSGSDIGVPKENILDLNNVHAPNENQDSDKASANAMPASPVIHNDSGFNPDNQNKAVGNDSDDDDDSFVDNMDLTEIKLGEIFKSKDGSGRKTLVFTNSSPIKISEANSLPKIDLLRSEIPSSKESQSESKEEMTMELTEVFQKSSVDLISKVEKTEIVTQSNQGSISDDEVMENMETMEFTKPISMNQNFKVPDVPKVSSGADNDDYIDEDITDNVTMEFTKVVQIQSLSSSTVAVVQTDNIQSDSDDSLDGETMELTKPLSVNLATSNSQNHIKPIEKQTSQQEPNQTSLSYDTTEKIHEHEEKSCESDAKRMTIDNTANVSPSADITEVQHAQNGSQTAALPSNDKTDTSLDINEEADQAISNISSPTMSQEKITPDVSENGHEGIEILDSDANERISNEESDEDSEILPDEKTLSNTIANSMLGKSVPITSSPIRNNYDDDQDIISREVSPLKVTQNSEINSPVKVNFDSSSSSIEEESEKIEQTSPERQKILVEQANVRDLTSPDKLQISPLRKNLTENVNGLLTEINPKLPKLNLFDQQILKYSRDESTAGNSSSKKRKRMSFPASNKRAKQSTKRKTISLGVSCFDTIEEENSKFIEQSDFDNTDSTKLMPSVDLTGTAVIEGSEPIVEDDYEPVTIEEFFNEINVKFFDDMVQSSVLSSNLVLPNNSGLSENVDSKLTQLEFGTSNEKLSTLELLIWGCKELKKYIGEGKELFSNLSKEIAEENPLTIKDYVTSTNEVKESMKDQFHLSKHYSKVEAQNDWYKWKTKLVNDLNKLSEKRLEILNHERENLQKKFEEYTVINDDLETKSAAISKRLSQIRFQNKFLHENNSTKHELMVMRAELVKQTNLLRESQGKLGVLQSELSEKERQSAQYVSDIEQLKEKITKSSEKLESSHSLESCSLYDLKLKAEKFVQACQIELLSIDEKNESVTVKLLSNELNEVPDSNITATIAYIKGINDFEFRIGKNFSFNQKLTKIDEPRFSPINSTLIEYFKKTMEQKMSTTQDKIKLFNFLRYFKNMFEKLAKELYFLSIKSRATVMLEASGESEKLVIRYKNFEREDCFKTFTWDEVVL